MARSVKGKTKKRRKNSKLLIAQAYTKQDYQDDKNTLEGVAGAAMTPSLVKSIKEIEARMRRGSW
tara:strand:+ start:256 stop:450 length:195 start_codon:yes stop_codon:yes gene_type:complete